MVDGLQAAEKLLTVKLPQIPATTAADLRKRKEDILERCRVLDEMMMQVIPAVVLSYVLVNCEVAAEELKNEYFANLNVVEILTMIPHLVNEHGEKDLRESCARCMPCIGPPIETVLRERKFKVGITADDYLHISLSW